MLPNLLYGQPPAGPTEVPDEWEVALDRIKLDHKLGEGFFGEVWKAVISGSFGPSERHASIVRILSAKRRIERQVPDEEQMVPVAVKLLKETATGEERKDLVNEIKLMKRIGCHQHIVSMMGCCTMTELYLIVEFVPYGDLLNFLRKNRQTRRPSPPLNAESLPESDYVPPSLPPTVSHSPMISYEILKSTRLDVCFIAHCRYLSSLTCTSGWDNLTHYMVVYWGIFVLFKYFLSGTSQNAVVPICV